MEACPHRPLALRTLVAFLVVLVASQFAFQVRDEGFLVPGSTQEPAKRHTLASAFPTAEASVLAGR